MEQYPTIRTVFDRRKQSSSQKEGTIEVEISFMRKRKWVSTGVKVLPKNWNNEKKVVGRMDAMDLNMAIENV